MPTATRPASSARGPVAPVSVCTGERGRGNGQPWGQCLTSNFLQEFELSSKNFEYQSCSSCQDLQVWFQAFSHLRLSLEVRILNSSLNENTLNLLFFEFSSKFHGVT